MENLLKQTIDCLKSNGKTPADVRWVGHKAPSYLEVIGKAEDTLPFGSWADFERHAGFDYDDGFGSEEVNSRLVIVGDDWWLERAEYDGSEWWEFKTLPHPAPNRAELRAKDLRSRF